MTTAGDTFAIEARHNSLTLHKRVSLSNLSDLRAFNDHAGKFDRIINSDGSWDVIDRSDGGNIVTVSPPSALEGTFVEDDFAIERYQEDKATRIGNTIDVRIRFVRTTPRDPEDTNDVLSESAGSDDWKLEFQHGTIATPVTFQTNQQEKNDIEMAMNLDADEAEVILENPNYLDAVSVETVPDGDDFIRDNNPDNRNTVTITRPSNANSEYLPNSGVDYIIRKWRLEWSQPLGRYICNMTVRKK